MINPTYKLPRINFVGGETKRLRFNLKTDSGDVIDAKGCTVALSIRDFSNPEGTYIYKINCNVIADANGVMSVAAVDLPSKDTMNLGGRYIYQLSVRDPDGRITIPGQGYMDIIKNIHPDF